MLHTETMIQVTHRTRHTLLQRLAGIPARDGVVVRYKVVKRHMRSDVYADLLD